MAPPDGALAVVPGGLGNEAVDASKRRVTAGYDGVGAEAIGSGSGLTGREGTVGAYGRASHHGGGVFSGENPARAGRSAVHARRRTTKNAVASGHALV